MKVLHGVEVLVIRAVIATEAIGALNFAAADAATMAANAKAAAFAANAAKATATSLSPQDLGFRV